MAEKAGSILVQGKVDKHRRMVDALKEYHSYTSKGALLHLTYECVPLPPPPPHSMTLDLDPLTRW